MIRVLAVDDDPSSLKITQTVLRNMNCELDLAVDGTSALESFRRSTYDLIFMDIIMPDMDGYEVTRRMRKHEGKTRYPVTIFAFTSCTEPDDQKKCLDVGMNGHLSKPFNPAEMKKIIDEVQSAKVQGKSCESCLHDDNCLYDHVPGKGFICWKKNPRYRPPN